MKYLEILKTGSLYNTDEKKVQSNMGDSERIENIQTGCRKKRKIFFWLRAVCFCALLITILLYACHILTPKYDYGMCSMMNLYSQKKDTVDVLVLGSSTSFAGINTNILWNEYGIAAYDLCCAEQGFWSSYYYLEEALKLQTPSLILLDAKPASYFEDHTSDARTVLSTSGIRSPLTRINAVRACVGDERALDFILWMPAVHGNYPNITLQDFGYPADNQGRGSDWKGYIEYTETMQVQRPSLVWNSVRKNIQEKEEEYARKIFELTAERNIPVLVVSIPSPDYAVDHMFCNTLKAIAEEYNVPFANYNDPNLRFGLRYSSDFSDWQHLNVKGSVTFTRQLGSDLLAEYDIPDRRGREGFESYDTCAEKWFAAYPEYAD